MESVKDKLFKFIKCPLIYVVVFCVIIQSLIYKTIPKYVMTTDSYTYSVEYTDNIFKGEVNGLRTPVYPYFIKAIKKVGGEDRLFENVVLVQKLLFIVSIILFYLCVIKLTKNKKILSSILTMIFGICPFFLFWNIIILTEALSILEILLISLFTIKYFEKKQLRYVFGISLMILISIFTRPSFIYLLPIYVFIWIMRFLFNKKELKNAIWGVVSCMIVGGFLLGYCALMKKQHGKFGISTVSYINNLVTCLNSGSYKLGSNQDILNDIEEIKGDRDDVEICWIVTSKLQGMYSSNELEEFANSALKNDRKNYIHYLIDKTMALGTVNIGTVDYFANLDEYLGINYYQISYLMCPINFAMVYLAIGISIIYLMYCLIKYSKIDWIVAFIFILILANLYTLIVGAPFESQRLFLSSAVLVLLLIGYVVAKLLAKKDKEEADENDLENNLFYKLFLEKTDDGKIQFLRYVFVGGVAAVVNIGSLFVLKEFLHMHYLLANIVGFVLGLITNYLLSKWLVFAKENSMNKVVEFITYAVIGVIGLGLDTLFMWVFTDKIHLYFMISKIIATGLVFIWNFAARKILYKVTNKSNE